MAGMSEDEHMTAQIADLGRRLARAEGVLAIQDLKAKYGELVYRRFSKGQLADPATLESVGNAVATLFTDDGVWDGGPALGRSIGRREIAARLREPTVAFARHFFLNPRISVDGDTGTGRWDVLSPCRSPDGTSYWMTGYEDDEYACVDGTWLHRTMKLTTVFLTRLGDGWTNVLV